jgi:hypothetical protein
MCAWLRGLEHLPCERTAVVSVVTSPLPVMTPSVKLDEGFRGVRQGRGAECDDAPQMLLGNGERDQLVVAGTFAAGPGEAVGAPPVLGPAFAKERSGWASRAFR